MSLKCRGGQIIINNIFGRAKGGQYRWKEVDHSNIEYSNKEQITDKKNVFNIYHSTQNKKGKTSSTQNKQGKEQKEEKIILTDTENSNSNNNEGKYDYDVNRAMGNKVNTMVSETEHSNNSINSDYSDDEYDSNRITKNEGGNVLNETGAVNGIASNEDDHDSKIIKSKDKKLSTEAQSVKKNNDS